MQLSSGGPACTLASIPTTGVWNGQYSDRGIWDSSNTVVTRGELSNEGVADQVNSVGK